MVHKPLRVLAAIAFVSDFVTVSAAYLLAYLLRFRFEIVPVTKGIAPLEIYLNFLPVALALWFAASWANGLYAPQRRLSRTDELFSVAKAGSVATLLLVALTFFYRDYSFSRVMLLLFWATSILLASSGRALIVIAVRARRRRGLNLSPALIVGAGDLGQTIARTIAGMPQLGMRVAGFVDDLPAAPGKPAGPPLLGRIDELPELLRAHRIALVFFALPREEHLQLERGLALIDKEVVDILVVPDILQFVMLRAGLASLGGIPMINLTETPLSGWYGPVKSAADVVFALLALVLLSPLLLAIALAIKITSPGPVFYRQERMSLDGTLFTMLKFRSMRADAEAETGAVWARPDDPRRTRLGAFLRRTSLDELPQLLNILRGEMSFVGPRPERPVFVEQFRERIPRYMLRHKVKCGLTGWAQVNGWRGDTSIEKRIECDIFYIENWSLAFDVKILLMTLWNGFLNKHAY
ncbi:MAG TPA: undecaprenyl-phosphate glucose phosphotransferase [Candidatus Methanoperedens sp.]|nr:undecaprenyl-phosphate glucose phosphotransferase [Candidatus Methanoperedens sp.]